MEEHGSGATRPVWLDEASLEGTRPLETDTHADVVVVGAGVAGLTTAYLLQEQGRSVVVLDDGPIGGGETSRTTAHLSNALDDRYRVLEKLRGEEVARHAATAHTAAIGMIERIVKAEALDCGFARLPGYLYPAFDQSPAELTEELAATRRAGLRTEWLDASPLPDWPGPCLVFPNQGQLRPLPYLSGLARAVERGGGRLFTAAHARGIEGGAMVRVETAHGPVVTASAVVVATNTPINDRFVIHTKQFPYRTYVVAVALPSGGVPAGLFWDDADPYHYVRSERVAGRDVLIVGGEDHKTGQADDAELRWSRLEAWARERFPAVGDVVARWSGQVLETLDGLGYIGRNPNDAGNVYIATGDSGMGMTHGTIAGILISDLVAGVENPWVEAFEPSRKVLRAAREYVAENVNVARQYGDWVGGGEEGPGSALGHGEGAVIERDGRQVAAYRDADGLLHLLSPVCPHLQCLVSWNSAERSWDCPCHGSRFDAGGRVLNGPANADLEPLEDEGPERPRPRPGRRPDEPRAER